MHPTEAEAVTLKWWNKVFFKLYLFCVVYGNSKFSKNLLCCHIDYLWTNISKKIINFVEYWLRSWALPFIMQRSDNLKCLNTRCTGYLSPFFYVRGAPWNKKNNLLKSLYTIYIWLSWRSGTVPVVSSTSTWKNIHSGKSKRGV